MARILRFHRMSIEFSSEDIRGFLRKHPNSSAGRIIDHLCPGFAFLPDTQRLQVWTHLRSTLRRMEEKGQIVCKGSPSGNVWNSCEAETAQ